MIDVCVGEMGNFPVTHAGVQESIQQKALTLRGRLQQFLDFVRVVFFRLTFRLRWPVILFDAHVAPTPFEEDRHVQESVVNCAFTQLFSLEEGLERQQVFALNIGDVQPLARFQEQFHRAVVCPPSGDGLVRLDLCQVCGGLVS